ncbi:wax ester/triacylglycerol synthase domain-containing protein [Nocardia sp. NPDC051990]|uniref:wax ester/triacylglycerol synthase domain-containing protein n=1 Tax=Nocardia sp. NPDC051990 TaxID=3155285 RepID=UPI00342F8868
MTQTDLFTWSMEQDPALRSTIITVLVLDREPEWNRFWHSIDRGTRMVPKFRHRLAAVPLGLAPPRWIPDDDFDLPWHVRHVIAPAPADLSTVLEFARTEAMTAFDPARPLWRITAMGGLDGAECALVLKVHHSLTDGIGGIQIAGEILDFTRAGTPREHEPSGDTPPNVRSGLGDIAAWNWSVGAELVRTGLSTVLPAAWRTVTNPIRTVREGVAVANSVVRFARPITSTLSPVMTDRSLGRQLSVLDVSAEALHRAAHAAGCTMNDAFLAAMLIGFRGYHDKHGAPVQHLRVTMPISLRTDRDAIGGNRITLARFTLPLDIAGTADLMRTLDALVADWRREPAIPLSNAIAAAFNRLPVGLLTPMFKHVDFIASDVPGSPVALYAAGAEVERIYAFGPTTGTALNATLISHVGTCYLGINADTAAIPDLPLLTDCLRSGFDTVLTLPDN